MKNRTVETARSEEGVKNAPHALAEDPLKLLLLPYATSPGAGILTLAHPATSKPCRYYWCPTKGLCELKRIAAPRKACRSWLLTPNALKGADAVEGGSPDEAQLPQDRKPLIEEVPKQEIPTARLSQQGHTIRTPEVFIATPMDVLFIILPTLYDQVSKGSKGLFLSLDDLLENACEKSNHLKHVMKQAAATESFEPRIRAACDMVEAGDKTMYRLSTYKLLLELLAKAKRMTLNGLPATMEAKFVEKALEVPMMSLKREESSNADMTPDNSTSADPSSVPSIDSQASTAASESVQSAISEQTEITLPDPPLPAVSETIKELLRLRTALQFIASSYLPPSLASTIMTACSSDTSAVDFKPLDTHLNHLASLRAEAQAARSLSDFSRKRSMVDDDEIAEAKAEKRRRKEEEEKRQKAGSSKAIKDLKKVNVTGMKKMSDFFGKKPTGKAK
ncbi:MAG: hypothetical protein Q9222_006074 [Ikaeria aurantiellina]